VLLITSVIVRLKKDNIWTLAADKIAILCVVLYGLMIFYNKSWVSENYILMVVLRKIMKNTFIQMQAKQQQEVVEAVTVIQEGTEIAIEVAKKKQVVVFREIMKNTFIQVHLKMEEALEEQRKSAKDAKDAKAVARIVANP